MSCLDCEHRWNVLCCLFDDPILSMYDSCFMDSTKQQKIEKDKQKGSFL